PYVPRHVSFFFLLPPRPPTSTLFPYTTLFRSGVGMTLPRHSLRLANQPLPGRQARRRAAVSYAASALAIRVRRRLLAVARLLLRDRKSTRLNSSHDQISYAVFCLKKKIQPHTE